MTARDLQLETMQMYRYLLRERPNWGGRLLLLTGADSVAAGTAPAASIAGGVSLVLDSDAAAIKSAQRSGWLDFVVNSLDEALRALKNEIRQKRPLSVGLIADVQATLGEIEERGILPDLHLDLVAPRSATADTDEHHFARTDPSALKAIDAALLQALPAEDAARRRWLQYAPQFLREARNGGRWIWLNEQELAILAAQGITPVPCP